MSGALVGRVLREGPENPTDAMVLVVIAEEMRDWPDMAVLGADEMARRARCDRRTVFRSVKRLTAAGWLAYFPGGGRGVANRYRMLPDRFSTGSETVTQRHPLRDEKQGHRAPVTPRNSDTDALNSGPVSPSPYPVETPSSARATDEPLAGVLVGVANGHDDDVIRVVLDGLGVGADRGIRAAINGAIREGWTASGLHEHLAGNLGPDVVKPAAVLRHLLGSLPMAPRPKPTLPPKCSRCDENRMIEQPDGSLARCPDCGTVAAAEDPGAARRRMAEMRNGRPLSRFAAG